MRHMSEFEREDLRAEYAEEIFEAKQRSRGRVQCNDCGAWYNPHLSFHSVDGIVHECPIDSQDKNRQGALWHTK